MNGRKSTYLFFMLTCPLFCSAQSDFKDSLQNKIGLGGWYAPNDYQLISSYSRVLKGENEICFSFYYYNLSASEEVIFGGAFYYSLFKKRRKFDLFLPVEINFNYFWFENYYSQETFSRHGGFMYLGFIPAYNFSKKISISLEFKWGIGYQWSKNYEYIYKGMVRNYHDYGWYSKGIGGLKLNYKF